MSNKNYFKLKNLINDSNFNSLEIDKKINQVADIFKSNDLLSSNLKIHEGTTKSYFLADAFARAYYTPYKDSQIGYAFNNFWDDDIYIDLPEYLFPLINIQKIYQTNELFNVSAGVQFDYSDWTVNYIEIKGDGSTLYAGDATHLLHTEREWTEEELTEFSIPIANTKDVYRGDITWTRSGYDYRILNGQLRAVVVIQDQGILGCGGLHWYNGYTFVPYPLFAGYVSSHMPTGAASPDLVYTKSYSKILNITSSTIEGVCVLKEEKHILTGGSCNEVDTTTENISASLSLEGNYRLCYTVYGTYQKYEGGNWVTQYTGQVEVDSMYSTSITQNFEKVGYFIYMSDYTQGIMNLADIGTDGYLRKYSLGGIPYTDTINTTLPYSQITFTRNKEPFPELTDLVSNIYSVAAPNSELQAMIIDDTNPIKKYKLAYNAPFVLTAKANVPITRSIPEYNDVYNSNGTAYVLTQNHTLKNRYVYYSQYGEVKYKTDIYLKNPMLINTKQEYKNDTK